MMGHRRDAWLALMAAAIRRLNGTAAATRLRTAGVAGLNASATTRYATRVIAAAASPASTACRRRIGDQQAHAQQYHHRKDDPSHDLSSSKSKLVECCNHNGIASIRSNPLQPRVACPVQGFLREKKTAARCGPYCTGGRELSQVAISNELTSVDNPACVRANATADRTSTASGLAGCHCVVRDAVGVRENLEIE
jgi:hypothetical protein